MKKYILIIFVIYSSIIFSQELTVVSLNNQAKSDELRYTEMINIDLKDGNAYYSRGQIRLYFLGDYKSAISDFTLAIKYGFKKDAEAYYMRAEAKSSVGDNRGALLDCTIALGLDKFRVNNLNSNNGYETRGLIQYSLKNYSAASKDFSESIKIDSENSNSFYWRGMCKLYLNSVDSGCLDLSRAGELGYEYAYEIIEKYCK